MSTFDNTAERIADIITGNGGRSVRAEVNPERQREIRAEYRDAHGKGRHLIVLCTPVHDNYAYLKDEVERKMADRPRLSSRINCGSCYVG
jgi:hypothetical protein